MAAKFTDTDGRQWTVKLTHARIHAVIDAVGVDLRLLTDKKTIDAIMDPAIVYTIIWTLVHDQHDASEQDFAEAIDGGVYYQMSTALEDAMRFFSQAAQPILAAALERAHQKTVEAKEDLSQKMLEMVEEKKNE